MLVEVVDPFRGRAHRHLVCRRREVLVAFPLHRETGRRREVVGGRYSPSSASAQVLWWCKLISFVTCTYVCVRVLS